MPNTADIGLQLSPDKRAMVVRKRRATVDYSYAGSSIHGYEALITLITDALDSARI